MEDSDDSFTSAVGIDEEHSDVFNSTGANETLSSEEENHPYVNRIIGKAALGGKKAKEHDVPEYKGKKCLVCRGKFNVKSKYQVCKLCDQLVHVNNNKKCHKMKKFAKDVNFICISCNGDSEEPRTANQDVSDTLQPNEAVRNKTFIIEKSVDYLNLTIDGFPVDGLIIRNLETSSGVEDPDSEVEPASEVSVEITADSPETTMNSPGTTSDSPETTADEEPVAVPEFAGERSLQCSQCSANAPHITGLEFHKLIEHSQQFKCHVCDESFDTKEKMLKHIDELHFYSCPICESIFLRSFEKKNHMLENHHDEDLVNHESDLEEEVFRRDIVRQSTLTKPLSITFVGDITNEMKDMKKNRRRGAK